MEEPMTSQAAQPSVEITPERAARRKRMVELTQKSDQLYAALKTISPEREDLVIAELEDGAIARELAELMGVSIGRIYKLRDNGLARR
jgi:DNA-directed RNA polymerase specialized sigma24 family protein